MEFNAMEESWMRRALELAARFRRAVHPNPMVGAVLVKEGVVIGEGAHEVYGGPHAEINALMAARRAGHDPAGAVMVVSLEPCSHHGKTPPCTAALIEAGVTRVIFALSDPNPKAEGGAKALMKAGLAVRCGLLSDEAAGLNRGFLQVQKTGLPWITLKTAQSLDAKLADHEGKSAWLTAEKAREAVQNLRECHDGVLVGTGTLLADDPRLTVRRHGAVQPVRLALDLNSRLTRLPRLVEEDPGSARLIVTHGKENHFHDAAEKAGAGLIRLAPGAGLPEVFSALAADGLTSILVEAGPKLATRLLNDGVFQQWHAFVAPCLLGGDRGYGLFDPPAPKPVHSPLRLQLCDINRHARTDQGGEDVELIFRLPE